MSIAHFGVYEPSSRMTPAFRDRAHRALHDRDAQRGRAYAATSSTSCCAAGSRSTARATLHASVPDEDVMPAPRTPYGVSLLEVEAIARRRAHASRRLGVCALRYAPVVGSHVPSPLGRLLRLPAVPVPAFADPPFSLLHPDDAAAAMVARDRAPLRRSAEHRRSGRGDAVAGRAARRSRPGPGAAAVLGRGRARPSRSRARRSRRTSSSCCATAAPGRAQPRRRRARPHRPALDAGSAARAVRVGRRRPDRNRAGGSGVSELVGAERELVTTGSTSTASAPRSRLPTALRRRFGGRYPFDPFGLDPHLADLVRADRVDASCASRSAARSTCPHRWRGRSSRTAASASSSRPRSRVAVQRADRAPAARRRCADRRRSSASFVPAARCDLRQRARPRDVRCAPGISSPCRSRRRGCAPARARHRCR